MNIYNDIQQLPPFDKAVITIGSFDGIHSGHRKILHRVRELANEINGESVVITFDPHPRSVLDPSSNALSVLTTLNEKLDLLKKVGIQNVVVVPFTFEFSQQAPREYIEKFIIGNFNPAYIVIGYDHRFGLNRNGDITLLREYEKQSNFQIVEILRQDIEDIAISSTRIRKAVFAGEMEEAAAYLGYPYLLTGRVVHGDQLGSKIGYPTANLQIDSKDKLIPKEGIYAVEIDIDDMIFGGMMYIGKRPTVSDQVIENIEINVFDFDQNIYDRNIQVSVIHYLRGDHKFPSVESMVRQIQQDEKDARSFLSTYKQKLPEPIDVTIAILNYNGVELLESYLPMMGYSSSKYNVDIVVIDNHSEDLSIDFVREWYPEIKTVELSKNYGFAEGYNKGLKDIDSEYIVIINSDVQVTENWLDSIIDAMNADKTIGAIQPGIKSMEDKSRFEYAGAAGGFMDALGYPFCRGRIFDTIEKDEGQYKDALEVFWASGAAMVVRNKLFKEIGGFDGAFFAHQEEIDLCWKIKMAGYSILCMPQSTVYHEGGSTLEYNNPRKDFLNFRNNLYLLTKNMQLTSLLWLIPIRLVLDGIAGIKFLVEGKPKSTLAIIRAHMSFYVHLPLVLERRNKEYQWIKHVKIDKPNFNGKYYGSIVYKYFVEGKKKFSQLKF
ncbi:MAG: bifunctional riboflavin kinase/FAD synthetase [Chitinophagales bacterium]|nr:bifunctional riboflavin kinase/FAD synthetase [Chitinophagales bacterium]